MEEATGVDGATALLEKTHLNFVIAHVFSVTGCGRGI